MIQYIFLIILLSSSTLAGYAGSYTGNYIGGAGGGSGGSGGYGYGYGGNIPSGFPQQFFQSIPFDFNSLLTGLQNIQSQVQQQAHAAGAVGNAGGYSYSGSYPSGYGTSGSAPSTYVSNGHQGGYAAPAYGSSYGGGYGGGYGGSYGGGYSGGYGGSYGSGGNYGSAGSYGSRPYLSSGFGGSGGYGAGASATIGAGGGHQSAFLTPENPASPNVNVRFGGANGGRGNAKSVFVSSSSSSGHVNGKPYYHRQASTTVNDNGKISSYSVHDKK